MITYFLIKWYLTLDISDLIVGPIGLGIFTLFMAIPIIGCGIEDNSLTKKAWLCLPLIVVCTFGFPIVIPLIIDLALIVFVVCIPAITIKSIVLVLRFLNTSLERKYEKFISENTKKFQ